MNQQNYNAENANTPGSLEVSVLLHALTLIAVLLNGTQTNQRESLKNNITTMDYEDTTQQTTTPYTSITDLTDEQRQRIINARREDLKALNKEFNLKPGHAVQYRYITKHKKISKPKEPKQAGNIMSVQIGNILCNIECDNTKVTGISVQDDVFTIKVSNV